MDTGSQGNQESGKSQGLQPWQPEKYVSSISTEEARYASGFLRSRPERWFPGFSAQWLPLAHSLGWDLRCLDIKPVTASSYDLAIGFVASLDDEPFGLALDQQSADLLANACIPGVSGVAGKIVMEYLARRFLQSLVTVWSAADQAVLRYEPDLTLRAVRSITAVDLVISINGSNIKVALLLGRGLTDRFDGLWRRQLLANSRLASAPQNLQIELAHLVVAPKMLTQYLKSGTDIDLDLPVSERVTVYSNDQPWLAGRMVRIDERLGLQVSSLSPVKLQIPDGTTRLSIQLGQVTVAPEALVELAQVGSVLRLDFNLSDQVKLVVGSQVVGAARLKVYQGRYAITVN